MKNSLCGKIQRRLSLDVTVCAHVQDKFAVICIWGSLRRTHVSSQMKIATFWEPFEASKMWQFFSGRPCPGFNMIRQNTMTSPGTSFHRFYYQDGQCKIGDIKINLP